MTLKFRKLVFILHRYLGLAIGLIAIVVGLTGSLLVFHSEIGDFDQQRQIGTIVPQGEPLPIEVILNRVQTAYANQPDAKLRRIYSPEKPDKPFDVIYATRQNDWVENLVHPYTGAILYNTLKPDGVDRFYKAVYELHYSFLAGDLGYKIVGTVGFLVCLLIITGLILWPGWRKLLVGFKIKWNAHPKRTNFDVHKVVGVVAVVFLLFTFFTGFCWNFSEFSEPVIRAITLSPQKPDPASTPIAGQAPRKLANQLKTAQAELPNGTLKRIYLPTTPEEALSVAFKLPQETEDYGQSTVYLDQYSGKVLRVDSSLKLSLGDRVLNSFSPLHYGTFGGLPTRILYVFIGLTPLILFITGSVMWWYRKRKDIRLVEVSEKSIARR